MLLLLLPLAAAAAAAAAAAISPHKLSGAACVYRPLYAEYAPRF